MRILSRYVTREFLRLFGIFVAAAPVLFIIGDITEKLDRYLDRGLSISDVALGYLYQCPLFILYSFPVAALIATIFTVNGLTRHLEIAAAKASGVSFYRMIAPLVVLAVLLTGAAVGLSELVPVTNRMRAEIMGDRKNQRSSRSDFVYRTRLGHVYTIRRLDVESGRIYRVSVEREGDGADAPPLHILARRGAYDDETGRWTLEDGYLRLFTGREESRTFHFDSLRPSGLTESPDELLAEPRDPDEMQYAELGRFIEILQRSGGQPLDLIVERAQKIALPVATLIIILFAAPLATSSRRGGTAYGVGVSLGITVTYLMLFKIAGAAGASGALPPVLAAWLPNIIFFAAALVLLSRVRT